MRLWRDDLRRNLIGSGAGGATLAHALAPAGLRILILERGQYLRREIETNATGRSVTDVVVTRDGGEERY